MSEFECINGHLMSGGVCKECGGRVYRMDGMTGKQLRMEEEADRLYDLMKGRSIDEEDQGEDEDE